MSQQLALDLDDGFQRLAALLESEDTPQGRMTLSALDGLIAAITVGPDLVLPSEWMALVWGPEPPVFESEEEAQAVLNALMDLYNDIVRSIQGHSYAPLFRFDVEGETDITDWCAGFIMGMTPHPKQWRRFVDSRHGYILLPIYAHLPELTDGAVGPGDLDDFDPDLHIPAMVAELYDYWRGRRRKRPGGTVVSSFSFGVKTGRNDPCPCGSGRKFKRCCLNVDAEGVLPGLSGETLG
jgi:uncharacterized protein